MTAQPSRRLSDDFARRVVTHCTDCLTRAEIPHPTIAASHPIEGFERVYDTLVLAFQPPLETQPTPAPAVSRQPRSGQAQTPAELVREALVLLHTLSCCPGYAFHETFAFWNCTLAQADPSTGAMPVKKGVRFPRVLLDWNPRCSAVQVRDADDPASLLMFKASVLEFFSIPSTRRLSRDGQKLLAILREFQASSDVSMTPIECIVSFRFARTASNSKAFVGSVISSATALSSSATTTSRTQSEFTLVGVRLAGCRNTWYKHRDLVTLANLKLLRRLCVSLPVSVALEFALPRPRHGRMPQTNESVSEPLMAFLMLAIGVSGTELLGRLTVLDLTHVSNSQRPPVALELAGLCTLLPHSRSLQMLRVTAETKTDLLWIAYAATHPLTPTTRWHTLHLSNFAPQCPRIDRLVDPSSLLAELWTETTHPSTTSTTTSNVGAPPDHYVRRTAKIAQDVQFFSSDKSKTFAQLIHGHDVELCDTTTPLNEIVLETGDSNLDDVAVVVAGVGLGWVQKRHLTQLMDTQYVGPPRSCITTLALAFYMGTTMSDVQILLSFFGPALAHLSTYRAPQLAIADVARTCPQLETLEMAVLPQGEDHKSNEHRAMPHLRFVGLVCSDLPSLTVSLHWLHSLSCLDTVSVRFEQYLPADDSRWAVIEDHLAQLAAARARTLRSLTTTYTGPAATTRVGADDRLTCDASSKRALLSVLQRAREKARESQTAVAQVGSDVVRRVFDFAGPSLTRRVVEVYNVWPSDWYDWQRPH